MFGVLKNKMLFFCLLHICISKTDRKNHTFWWKKFGPLLSFQYVWFWLRFHFNLFLLHSLLVRPSWGSGKSTHKSSPFFEFSRKTAYKISIDLVLLWCQTFLFLLPRSWFFLLLLPRSLRILLDFFSRSWKFLQNLADLAKNNCQDLGQKCQNPRNFLAKKPRHQAVDSMVQISKHLHQKKMLKKDRSRMRSNATNFVQPIQAKTKSTQIRKKSTKKNLKLFFTSSKLLACFFDKKA